jgi:MFS family permease
MSIGFALLETAGNAYLSKILEESQSNMKGSGFGFNNTLGFFCSGVGPMIIAFLGELNTFLPYYLISFILIGVLLITIKFLKS